MKTFTIFSSETVVYRTEVKAESYDDAIDKFYNENYVKGELIPDSYDGFQIDKVEEES